MQFPLQCLVVCIWYSDFIRVYPTPWLCLLVGLRRDVHVSWWLIMLGGACSLQTLPQTCSTTCCVWGSGMTVQTSRYFSRPPSPTTCLTSLHMCTPWEVTVFLLALGFCKCSRVVHSLALARKQLQILCTTGFNGKRLHAVWMVSNPNSIQLPWRVTGSTVWTSVVSFSHVLVGWPQDCLH